MLNFEQVDYLKDNQNHHKRVEISFSYNIIKDYISFLYIISFNVFSCSVIRSTNWGIYFTDRNFQFIPIFHNFNIVWKTFDIIESFSFFSHFHCWGTYLFLQHLHNLSILEIITFLRIHHRQEFPILPILQKSVFLIIHSRQDLTIVENYINVKLYLFVYCL